MLVFRGVYIYIKIIVLTLKIGLVAAHQKIGQLIAESIYHNQNMFPKISTAFLFFRAKHHQVPKDEGFVPLLFGILEIPPGGYLAFDW